MGQSRLNEAGRSSAAAKDVSCPAQAVDIPATVTLGLPFRLRVSLAVKGRFGAESDTGQQIRCSRYGAADTA